MAVVKGGFLRLLQTLLYAIAFACAAIILGFYSYFLSVRADRNEGIPTWEKAVEGISGAAVLYTIFATILTCCLGGISFFAFLAIVLDLLFVGGMLAIAVLTRHGASSCKGTVNTPLGTGAASSHSSGFGNFGTGSNENVTYAVSLKTACRYNTVCFAVSIIAAFIFLCTALMQLALIRHHKKEKRLGPSPKNNYTSGYGKRKFWQRKPKSHATKDAEMGAGVGAAGGLAAAHHHHDTRTSHETGYTGTTVGNHATNEHNKVEQPAGAHTGYYTQPQGTGVNPYGYDQRTTGTATNY